MELTLWTNCAMLHEPIKHPQMLGISFHDFACSTHIFYVCCLHGTKRNPYVILHMYFNVHAKMLVRDFIVEIGKHVAQGQKT